jgi:hypothetical protein
VYQASRERDAEAIYRHHRDGDALEEVLGDQYFAARFPGAATEAAS